MSNNLIVRTKLFADKNLRLLFLESFEKISSGNERSLRKFISVSLFPCQLIPIMGLFSLEKISLHFLISWSVEKI